MFLLIIIISYNSTHSIMILIYFRRGKFSSSKFLVILISLKLPVNHQLTYSHFIASIHINPFATPFFKRCLICSNWGRGMFLIHLLIVKVSKNLKLLKLVLIPAYLCSRRRLRCDHSDHWFFCRLNLPPLKKFTHSFTYRHFPWNNICWNHHLIQI